MAGRTAKRKAGGSVHARRLRVALVSGIAIWMFIVGRLAMIQIVHSPRLAERATDQQVTEVVISADRGTIYDRNMVPLTNNLTVKSVCAYPKKIESAHTVAHALARVLGGSYRDYLPKLTHNGNFSWIKRQIPPDVATRLAALDLPGIGFLTESKRVYPFGKIGGQVIGMTDVDGNGLSGIELQLDEELTGATETVVHLLDCTRRQTPAPACTMIEPRDGASVVLTIDIRLQEIAEVELERGVREHEAKTGMVVIQDPKTGEILAMASWPSFDPNCPQRYSTESQKNRVLTDQFEPGSTFKLITAAAALQTGAADRTCVYHAGRGKARLGPCTIHDVKKYGWLPFDLAYAKSSNVCFAQIGKAVGGVLLYAIARDFGFGCLTGIGLPGEVRGVLREPDEWSRRSVYTIAIGQEVAVTAVQLIGAYSAIANGGYLMDPRITKALIADDGKVLEETRPSVVRQVVDQRVAASMRELLRLVTVCGTGKQAQVDEVAVSGKTGTAQKVQVGKRGYDPTKWIGSFVGMAPADDPEIVCLVVIDEPKGRGLGGVVAAPVFSRIVQRIVRGPGYGYVLSNGDRSEGVDGAPDLHADAGGGGGSREPGPFDASAASPSSADQTGSATDVVHAHQAGGNGGRGRSSEATSDMATSDVASAGAASARAASEEDARSWAGGVPLDVLLPATTDEETVEVPDLRGLSVRLARRTASAKGLLVSFDGTGTVGSQSLRAGSTARPGDRMTATCATR